jgi:hypothetical protein
MNEANELWGEISLEGPWPTIVDVGKSVGEERSESREILHDLSTRSCGTVDRV